MKTITAQDRDDGLETVADTLVLTGPPDALRGQLLLRNNGKAPLFIRSAGLEFERAGRSVSPGGQELDLDLRLEPGQTASRGLKLRLDATLPPGDYPARLAVG